MSTEVVVTSYGRDDLVLSVGGRDPAATLGGPDAVVLEADGALLVWASWDDELPGALVHDPAAVQRWLWEVHSEPLALALAALAAGGGTGTVTVAAEPGPLAGAARLAARGHWAARWWPTSVLDGLPGLDTDVLGLELAVASQECERVLGPDEESPAGLLEAHAAGVQRLREWATSPVHAPYAGAVARLRERVEALADELGVELSAATTSPAARADFALAAAGGDGRAQGSLENDWTAYPPGLLDASESALTWRADLDSPGWRVGGVAAAGAVAAPLVLRGTDGEQPFELTPTGWRGLVPAGPAPGVRVALPGFDPGPLGGAGDRLAARERARGFARAWLADPGAPLAVLVAADDPEDF